MAGPRVSEVGGGPATGLANDFVKFLQGGLNTGSFGGVTAGQQFGGANPVGNTQGIAGVLNDILAGGGGNLGGSLQQLIQSQQGRDVNDLRARFTAGGGTSLGTPAASAEALYRSEAAPQAAIATGQLQMSALLPILQMMTGLSSKGISQRETIATPSTLGQIGQIAGPLAAAALPLIFPPAAAAAPFLAGAGSLFSQSRGAQEFKESLPQLDFGIGKMDPNLFQIPNFNPNSLRR